MSRERPLPDEKALEKIGRYEGHLSRGLYRALHELEALQIRRSGARLLWLDLAWKDCRGAKSVSRPILVHLGNF